MIEQISGVLVSVYQHDKDVSVGEDGYMGRLSPGQVLIHVDVEPDRQVFGFVVDGSKNVVAKRNLVREPEGSKFYQLVVPVNEGQQGGAYSVYPTNNLRLVEQLVDRPDFNTTGAVRVWEIAVVSQNGEFFLTVQPVYEALCYQDTAGRRTYPRFAQWPQLDEFLVQLLPANVSSPPTISTYEKGELTPNGLQGNEGLVDWFNDAQGIGCLLLPKGETARVHWSQVAPRPRRSYLRRGEVVRFKGLRAPTMTRGRSTSFGQEAIGVTPL